MNGDLLLLRKRWWGAWLIMAAAAFCFMIFLSDALELARKGDDVARVDFIAACICLVCMLVCYAPWTFFWILRVVGVLLCVGTIAFVIDSVRKGESVGAALHAVVTFGVPGALVAWLRLPSACPYDERGRLIPIEVVRSVRLRRERGVDASNWATMVADHVAQLQLSRRERRALVLRAEPDGEQSLSVRHLIGPKGQAFLSRVLAQLEDRGVHCELGAETPTPTTFRTLLLQCIHAESAVR